MENTEKVETKIIPDRRRKDNKPPYVMIALIIGVSLWLFSKAAWAVHSELQEGKKEKIELEKTTNSIKELSKKVETVLLGNIIYNANYTAFTYNSEASLCLDCHLKPHRYLLRSNLTLQLFKDYVRGTERHIKNDVMPVFSKEMISDNTLENMYVILRRSRPE